MQRTPERLLGSALVNNVVLIILMDTNPPTYQPWVTDLLFSSQYDTWAFISTAERPGSDEILPCIDVERRFYSSGPEWTLKASSCAISSLQPGPRKVINSLLPLRCLHPLKKNCFLSQERLAPQSLSASLLFSFPSFNSFQQDIATDLSPCPVFLLKASEKKGNYSRGGRGTGVIVRKKKQSGCQR